MTDDKFKPLTMAEFEAIIANYYTPDTRDGRDANWEQFVAQIRRSVALHNIVWQAQGQ